MAVQLKGWRDLTRDLGKISKDLKRDTLRKLREIGKPIRDEAARDVPHKTGEYALSLKVSATQRGGAITSRLPQAGVLEYGGNIAPRGVTIHFAPRMDISHAIDDHADDVEQQLGDLFERIARADGFPF